MARKAVIDAVYARINVNLGGQIQIIPQNDLGKVPDAGTSFLSVAFPFSSARQLTFDGKQREQGSARIVVAFEIGKGKDAFNAMVETICGLFTNVRIDASGAVNQASPINFRTPTVIDPVQDGAYWRGAVSASYVLFY